MSDEPRPPDPPAASASISDSTISDSTVHLTSMDQRGQQVGTQYNAGRDVHVTHHAPTWQPRYEPPRDQAQDLLDALLAPALPPISPLPSGARMPFAPNPHFVGRDAILLALARALHGGARVAIGPKAAATGLGGIGKTSIAVELAHRYGTFFAGGVFWLSFADPAAVASEIAACGGPGLLDLHPSYGELKQDDQLALVREAWQRPIPRLLIFDNAEDPQLVQQWAPPSGGCRVLITSRRQSWPGRIVTHSLDVLARAASVALLRDLAPRLTPEEADALAEELGDFPLALQLAGSYLAQYDRISVAAYLAELRSDVILAHPSLQGKHDGDVSTTAHDRHVGRTFLVSYQKLDPQRDTLALALLARAACLAPGAPIPVNVMLALSEVSRQQPASFWKRLSRSSNKALPTGLPVVERYAALQRLASLGLLNVVPDWIMMHRLVQAFVWSVVHLDTVAADVEAVLIKQAYEVNVSGYPMAMQALLPHLWWTVRYRDTRNDRSMATLCSNLGFYLDMTGNYGGARSLLERSLVINEGLLGPNHPDTANSLNNLAALLVAMGADREAQPLYERALVIYETTLPPMHPSIALSLNNLAALFRLVGDYAQALPLIERALAINETALGPTHPATAWSLHNLALLFRARGDYVQARPLAERALAINEGVLGATHPATARSLKSLAEILIAIGEVDRAWPLLQRSLEIRETALGPAHPSTIRSLNRLALLLASIGRTAEARSLYERALIRCEQTFGRDHSITQVIRDNLETLLSQIKDTE